MADNANSTWIMPVYKMYVDGDNQPVYAGGGDEFKKFPLAAVKEYPVWVTPVHKIDFDEPLMGGEFGTNNIQAKQLGSRTLYLKDLFLLEHNPDGSHSLDGSHVETDAAIAESKLDLPYYTKDVAAYISKLTAALDAVNEGITAITGENSYILKALYMAIHMAWRYGHPRFLFDMFANNFTLRDFVKEIPLIETVRGDDSIDVSEDDSKSVNVGHTYLIYDKDKKMRRVVSIKAVLEMGRVLLWDNEDTTRLHTGVLTKTDWDLSLGSAKTYNGSCYITGFLTILDDFHRGYLVINHSEDIDFSAAYNRYNAYKEPVWIDIPVVSKTWSAKLGCWLTYIETPGGQFALKIQAHGETTINQLCVISDIQGALVNTVRTPVALDPSFQLVRFGAIYGAKHVKTEIQFSSNGVFDDDSETIFLPASEDKNPVWDLKEQVLAAHTISESCYWRARYYASDGYVSEWSTPAFYEK